MNCERCDDLFNDLPWRHAEEGNTHTCQRKNLPYPYHISAENAKNVLCVIYPQAVSATATPSAVILIWPRTKPAGGEVEECVRLACTTQQGLSVTVVPQATSPTPAAK